MWNLYQIKTSKYNLRAVNTLKLKTPKTNKYGVNSIDFRGSLLWNYISNELKRSERVNSNQRSKNIKVLNAPVYRADRCIINYFLYVNDILIFSILVQYLHLIYNCNFISLSRLLTILFLVTTAKPTLNK